MLPRVDDWIPCQRTSRSLVGSYRLLSYPSSLSPLKGSPWPPRQPVLSADAVSFCLMVLTHAPLTSSLNPSGETSLRLLCSKLSRDNQKKSQVIHSSRASGVVSMSEMHNAT